MIAEAGQSKQSKKEATMSSNTFQQQQQRNAISENSDISKGRVGIPSLPFASPGGNALVAGNGKSENQDSKYRPLSSHSAAAVVSSVSRSSLSPKAEALAEAYRGRVEAEAQAYLESEIRKLEAKSQKLQSKAERQRMHEETKALESKRREEARAEQVIYAAEVRAEKILLKARVDALKLRAHANEQTEKNIADAYTRAERWKAEIQETKKKEVAEVTDCVHMMIAIGELPSAKEGKGVVKRMTQSWACHP